MLIIIPNAIATAQIKPESPRDYVMETPRRMRVRETLEDQSAETSCDCLAQFYRTLCSIITPTAPSNTQIYIDESNRQIV